MKKQLIISTIISALSPFLAYYLDLLSSRIFYQLDKMLFGQYGSVDSGWLYAAHVDVWALAINFVLLFLLILRYVSRKEK